MKTRDQNCKGRLPAENLLKISLKKYTLKSGRHVFSSWYYLNSINLISRSFVNLPSLVNYLQPYLPITFQLFRDLAIIHPFVVLGSIKDSTSCIISSNPWGSQRIVYTRTSDFRASVPSLFISSGIMEYTDETFLFSNKMKKFTEGERIFFSSYLCHWDNPQRILLFFKINFSVVETHPRFICFLSIQFCFSFFLTSLRFNYLPKNWNGLKCTIFFGRKSI